jgi:hypothetical protein
MIIVTEKNKTYEQLHRINEAQEIPVLRFETFVQTIISGEFKPNHIEIYSKQSTRFHVTFSGKYTIDAQRTLVDFYQKDRASTITIVSIGENDVTRIHKNANPKYPYFRIEMKTGLLFYISQV